MPHLISVKLFQKNDTGKLRAFLEKFTFSFIAIRQPRPILLFRRGSQDGVSKKEISCLRKGGYFDIEPRDWMSKSNHLHLLVLFHRVLEIWYQYF